MAFEVYGLHCPQAIMYFLCGGPQRHMIAQGQKRRPALEGHVRVTPLQVYIY